MARKIKVNFEGVSKEIKRGSSRVHIPEGDYLVKIIDHELVKDRDTGRTKGIRWNAQITKGPEKGKKLGGFTSLKPEALWSLRNLIHAATGRNVAGKAVDLDPSRLYGKEVGAEVTDNEYTKDGNTRVTSQINTFFPADEVDADEEEDEDEDEDEEGDEEEEEEDEDLEDVEVEEL